MALSTQWTWVWASSGSWWWTEKPGMLQSNGSQRVGHDWAAELNWDLINGVVMLQANSEGTQSDIYVSDLLPNPLPSSLSRVPCVDRRSSLLSHLKYCSVVGFFHTKSSQCGVHFTLVAISVWTSYIYFILFISGCTAFSLWHVGFL